MKKNIYLDTFFTSLYTNTELNFVFYLIPFYYRRKHVGKYLKDYFLENSFKLNCIFLMCSLPSDAAIIKFVKIETDANV